MQDGYEDIINLPHHVSEKHPPMPLIKRAAQFAPFAALAGYDDAIDAAAAMSEEKLLSDTEKNAAG